MRKRTWIHLLAAGLLPLLLLAAGPVACTGDTRADDGEERAEAAAGGEANGTPEAVPVEVAPVARGAIEAVLSFSTNLEAEEDVEVYSEAARRVRSLAVEEGHRVRRGQVLLTLEDAEQRTALAKVETLHAKAKREYERQKKLFANELISEQAINEATYELDRLELELEEARRQLSYTQVKAPIAGTITRRLVNVGDHITVNQHLFDIVDFGSLVARVYVPEKELPRLLRGLAARVTSPALGGRVIDGRVERIAPVVDPRSGTVKVTVALPEVAGLLPGMYVDVALVTAVRDDALLVPKRALVYDDDQIFVYRLAGDGDQARVERVLLRPVLEDKDHVEPEAGFAAGDRVVVAGQAGLKDGARVRPVSPAGDARIVPAAGS